MSRKVNWTLRACFAVVFALLFVSVLPSAATIQYKISLQDPGQHRFHVQMNISKPSAETLVTLPAWNALYQVRDFAYRVRDVRAMAGEPDSPKLAIQKLDKQTWGIVAPSSAMPSGIKVDYTIEWNDPGPFNSQLNEHHAFVNFAEVLMYVPSRRNEETEVEFEKVPSDWHLISQLQNGAAANSFKATSYDDLVDTPVEAGKFEQFEFDNEGAHFRVVVDAKEWSKSRLEDDLRRITGYELKLMGGPPFKEYTFFFHIGAYPEVGGGGMEHSNCTAISAGSVEGAAQIAAHEFFHAWNVKRIRPQALQPVDFTKEQFTRALWFAEGVTSTYGAYTLERSGLWSKDQFYGDLGSQIEVLQSRPAHAWQSAEESSLDTWFDKYDAYGLPDRSISYYNKGQILGVMLDLALRHATDNHKSLDDVLRALNEEYAKKGKFYNESEGIRAVVEEVAGKPFGEFFASYVAGTHEIPYADFLAFAGLELKTESVKLADPGFSPDRAPGGVAVTSVNSGGPAEAAGLREGDVIVEVNGHPFPRGRAGLLSGLSGGETVKFHVTRQGQDLDISYVLGSREDTRYSFKEIAHATDRQRRIREGILHGTTD